VGKRQFKLSPDLDEARRLAHRILAEVLEETILPTSGTPAELLVVEVCDQFLEWCRAHKARLTYEAYRRRLQHLVDDLKRNDEALLPISGFRPLHVSRVMTAHPEWAANTKADFAGACNRAMNWALKQGILERNPVVGVEKPGREARDLVVSPKDFELILSGILEPTLRDLVELAWETGARVQELRKVEARFVDLANSRLVFPPKEAKGKRHHRVIYLGTERSRDLVARLVRQFPEGPILRNSDGNPWTKDAINCAFCRLRVRVAELLMAREGLGRPGSSGDVPGEKRMPGRAERRAALARWQEERARFVRDRVPKVHLGAMRKGFATEALKAGLDTITVAHLLGHRDGTMVSKHYGHVQQDPEHMARAARRARGGDGEGK
jgi:integrase